VDKVTNPSGDSTSFTFTTTGSGFNGFSLTDQAAPNDQTLLPGNFSVAETAVSGWTQTSATCTSSIGDTESIGTLELDPGETITCTFTNTKLAHVIIVKDAQPNSAQDFTFTNNFGNGNPGSFSLDDDSDNALSNSRDFIVNPGTYAVSEGAVAGWNNTSATCDQGETIDSIDVAAGETVTCTFVNTQNAKIIVDKVTSPSGNSQSFAFTTTGSGYTGFSLTDAAAPNEQTLTPGTYSVAETAVAGWDLTSSTCVSSIQDTETPASIELDAGETVTCTFTNTQQGSHIIIIKDAQPNDAQDFTFTNNFGNGNPASFSLDDDSDNTLSNTRNFSVTPGTYNIAENAQAGWTQTSATCDQGETPGSIDVAAGETVTCTFVNTKIVAVQGCSPGYWKQPQHFGSYPEGVFPNDLFTSVGFENAFPGKTLLQVLSQGGGGLNALGRIIVGAYLNASTIDNFAFTPEEVVADFNAVFPGGDYNALKAKYEALQDPCPLGRNPGPASGTTTSVPTSSSVTTAENTQAVVVTDQPKNSDTKIVVTDQPSSEPAVEPKSNNGNGKALGKTK